MLKTAITLKRKNGSNTLEKWRWDDDESKKDY